MKNLILCLFLAISVFGFTQNKYLLKFEGLDQIQVKQIVGKLMPVFESYPLVNETFEEFIYTSEKEIIREDVAILLKEMEIELKDFEKESNE